MIMKNVRQKLADACKNVEMSRELNEFTSYMATVVNDELNPEGMLLMYACVVDDIRNGKSGFATDYNGKLPQYLIDKKSQVLAQAVYFPQVIDEIAEPEFAERFREGCKGAFNIDPPKKINPKIEGEYPEYVTIAVEWWTKAIASPKHDNGEDLGQLWQSLQQREKIKVVLKNLSKSLKKFWQKALKNRLRSMVIVHLMWITMHVSYLWKLRRNLSLILCLIFLGKRI